MTRFADGPTGCAAGCFRARDDHDVQYVNAEPGCPEHDVPPTSTPTSTSLAPALTPSQLAEDPWQASVDPAAWGPEPW